MRYRIPVLALLFILALSACTLGSDDDNATPTVDTQTLASPTPTGRPTVSIISPQTGSEVVVNSPILMSVNATDTVGVTRVQLLVDGQIARTFSSENPTGDPNNNLVIDYTPREQGDVILQVVAYRGTVASDPAEITVFVRGNQTQITATTQPESGIPTIDPFDPTCRALINTALNFRTGPSTDYARIRTLSYGEVLPIIGRIGDNTWLKLRDGSWSEGWVSADYVATYGNCNNVPIVQAPATPTSQNAPTATNTTVPATNTATTVPATTVPTEPPKPNLVVSNVDGPDTVTIPSGETSVAEQFNVNVTNLGGALDTQFSTVAIMLPGGTQFDVGVVANLGAGQSISLGTTITFDTAGTFALQFTVDSDAQIDESNEIDNSVVFNVTVENE